MTTRLRFPALLNRTLFETVFVNPPMQHAPVRVAIATAVSALVGVAAVLAL